MMGAVQLGLFAACVVLFVPMGMAGWLAFELEQDTFFFSCALFISLAVGIHLMPYFPSLAPVKVIPASISLYRDSCVSLLHSVTYSDVRECDESLIASDGSRCKRSWDWIEAAQVAECEFQKLKKLEASDLFNGSWIVVAGDFQASLMVVSLSQLLLGSENVERVRRNLFKRHSNYSITAEEIGVKLDFVWAPYVKNLAEFMSQLRSKNYPDVMVTGLWDMLHISNSYEYDVYLRVLRDNVLALLPVASDMDASAGGLSELKYSHVLHMFWVGMPKLITSMLSAEEEKRKRMTIEMCDYYENALVWWATFQIRYLLVE